MEVIAAAFPWEDLIYALLAAITAFFGAHRGARNGTRPKLK